jgi:hypothetical protein
MTGRDHPLLRIQGAPKPDADRRKFPLFLEDLYLMVNLGQNPGSTVCTVNR